MIRQILLLKDASRGHYLYQSFTDNQSMQKSFPYNSFTSILFLLKVGANFNRLNISVNRKLEIWAWRSFKTRLKIALSGYGQDKQNTTLWIFNLKCYHLALYLLISSHISFAFLVFAHWNDGQWARLTLAMDFARTELHFIESRLYLQKKHFLWDQGCRNIRRNKFLSDCW